VAGSVKDLVGGLIESQCPMRLVRVSSEPPGGLFELLEEMKDENGFIGDSRVAAGELSIAAYLQELVEMSEGRNLRPGWVPMTTFWLLDASDTAVGVSRLRHRLTDNLLKSGGHIGYFVKRAERGKRYGTTILRLTLEEARRLGIAQALLTVYADNLPSVRVIEANGGVLHDETLEVSGRPHRRYWIEIAHRNGAWA
jgi:predicted acetyltransferase